MDVDATIAELPDDALWKFAVNATDRVHADLTLGPHTTEATNALRSLIGGGIPDELDITRAASAVRDAVQKDDPGHAATLTDWADITVAAIVNRPIMGRIARRAGDTRDAQWADIAELTGVPADIAELWASLADDWNGSPAELTEAARAART